MGTADFAVPSLRALVAAGYRVPLVVTRPDKPKGRGLELSITPVKAAALELGLDVFQPSGLRDPAVQERLAACNADFFVVAAYGRILPPAVLAMPRYGCVNVHGSLLPRYRGAAPIQWSVINGEPETGVTIMLIDEGCDTGAILLMERTPVRPDDTAASLFDRLAAMGPPLLISAMRGLAEGKIVAVPQDHSMATLAPIMDKSVGDIDWSAPTRRIADLVRGVEPWPGAFTWTPAGIRVRVFPFLKECAPRACEDGWESIEPGTVLKVGVGDDGSGHGEAMVIRTGDGAVVVCEVQPAGSRRMTPAAMVAGRRLAVGDILCRGPVGGA
jgi:methionyl-tRNA formyltransferase